MKLIITNTIFGKEGTIGQRVLPIAEKAGKDTLILCNGYKKGIEKQFKIKQIFRRSDKIFKALVATEIITKRKIRTDSYRAKLFEKNVIKQLRNIDFKKIKTIHSWEYMPNFYKQIKKQDPHIKIIQDVSIALPTLVTKLKEFHKSQFVIPKYIENALPHVDLFIVPSEYVKKSLQKINVPTKKIVIIPFGVDSKKFKPLKKKSDMFNVAFAGNISTRKGLVYLVNAWNSLDLPDSKLNLYGRLFPEMKGKIKGKKIKLHGFADLQKELPKNNIYVFPSLHEGSSKSVYEAMASGLPIITTFNSGSVITNGKEGYIIPIADSTEIAQKIKFLHDNPKTLQKMAKEARKTAIKYSWEKYGKATVKYYH